MKVKLTIEFMTAHPFSYEVESVDIANQAILDIATASAGDRDRLIRIDLGKNHAAVRPSDIRQVYITESEA